MKIRNMIAGIVLATVTMGANAQNETDSQNSAVARIVFDKKKSKMYSNVVDICKRRVKVLTSDGSVKTLNQFKLDIDVCVSNATTVQSLLTIVRSNVAYRAIERLERRIIELESKISELELLSRGTSEGSRTFSWTD